MSFAFREEYDKRVAKEITEKLERDLQEQRLRELESEKIAQDMQVRDSFLSHFFIHQKHPNALEWEICFFFLTK